MEWGLLNQQEIAVTVSTVQEAKVPLHQKNTAALEGRCVQLEVTSLLSVQGVMKSKIYKNY